MIVKYLKTFPCLSFSILTSNITHFCTMNNYVFSCTYKPSDFSCINIRPDHKTVKNSGSTSQIIIIWKYTELEICHNYCYCTDTVVFSKRYYKARSHTNMYSHECMWLNITAFLENRIKYIKSPRLHSRFPLSTRFLKGREQLKIMWYSHVAVQFCHIGTLAEKEGKRHQTMARGKRTENDRKDRRKFG